MNGKILVVDDEADICRLLSDELTMEGYSVLCAKSAGEALEKIGEMPDLILLDVMMPGMDGYALCEKIRGQVSCPILFLTAKAEENDCIRGLRAGGDDYISKPFSMDELLERIGAHLRREQRQTKPRQVYRMGELTVDVPGARVEKQGRDIRLTKTEFAILEFLLLNRGQVFDKERIYEATRGFDGTADAAIVAEHVRRIRNKLGQSADGRDYIETVWGVGYRWIG